MIILSYLPGEPAVAYTAYHPSLIEILTGARDRQLRSAGFFPGSTLPESCGPQCSKGPYRGGKGYRGNPGARRLIGQFGWKNGLHCRRPFSYFPIKTYRTNPEKSLSEALIP